MVEEQHGQRERRSGWTDPRVVVSLVAVFGQGCAILLSFVGLCVLIGGGLVGIYVVSQTKTATSEMSTGQLAVEIGKLNTNIDRLDGKVTTAIGTLTTAQGRIDTVSRDVEQLRGTDKDLQDRLMTLERDYTSNITTRLARLEAASGKGN